VTKPFRRPISIVVRMISANLISLLHRLEPPLLGDQRAQCHFWWRWNKL